jgi:hypothetical protein
MSKKATSPQVASAVTPSRPGIHCEFKPKAAARKIRFATAVEAEAAGKWAIEKYSEAFRQLAK